ncbi:MAG TPA: CHAT domain-containing protein, partial [Pyrinomonadaceae bacterium]|nr:CHAT domain-containing protein [Pyrinomonadaceae bacterium]
MQLNLLSEAAELYESSARVFEELGMRAELARCSLNLARTLFLTGEINEARLQIEKAETLFQSEGNLVATASAQVFKSQIFYLENDFATAKNLAENALEVFTKNKNLRFELFGRWLLGEIALAKNDLKRASEIFEKTLSDAENNSSSIENLCLNALGKIAVKRNKKSDAERFFRRSVKLTENTRSTLQAEEFRMAFLGDKLFPFLEISKIKLAEKDLKEAFLWLERSRSRSLLDAIETPSISADSSQHDDKIYAKIEKLRGELNWFYSRLNRNSTSGLEARKELKSLKKEVFERENQLLELERRLPKNSGTKFEFEVEDLQGRLGETVLVEYAVFDGKISAFLISQNDIQFYENIAAEKTVNEEIAQFLFQIKTARFIDKLSESNQKLALLRVIKHSQKLYDLLVKPLCLDAKKIVFVPTNQLHYLPFHALSDGNNFLIEICEIAYAPSAAVLANCL